MAQPQELVGIRLERGRTARARATNSSAAVASSSGHSGYSCSPDRRRLSRLVTISTRPGHRSSHPPTVGAASSTCSKLSSTSSTSPACTSSRAGVGSDQCRDLRLHQVGGRHSRQVSEPDPIDKTVGKPGCERSGERGLADPADARQRDESSAAAHQRPEVVQLTHSTDQRLTRRLEMLRPIDRTGGKSACPHWNNCTSPTSFRRWNPRSRTGSSGTSPRVWQEEDDLTTAAGGRDPRGDVHIHPHVALLDTRRRAGMHPIRMRTGPSGPESSTTARAAATASDARERRGRRRPPGCPPPCRHGVRRSRAPSADARRAATGTARPDRRRAPSSPRCR